MTEDLINPVKLRASIKRMFSNDIFEAISELLQNSQRSGATIVDISTEGNTLTYKDNGHGVKKGPQGWETLLTLGGSDYDPQVMQEQNPMGLGLNALLVLEDIEKVSIESNGWGILNLDTTKWWNDPEYWRGWEHLLFKRPPSQAQWGMVITVKYKEGKKVPDLSWLTHTGSYGGDLDNPASGYYDLLKISINNKAIEWNTPYPYWTAEDQDLIWSGKYKGNKLVLKGLEHTYSYPYLVVNWYGQIIKCKAPSNYLKVYLEVRKGKPIEPLAPVRSGLIKNELYKELTEFIKDRVYECALKGIKEGPLTCKYKGLMDLDSSLFDEQFILAEKVIPYEEGDYHEYKERPEYIFLKDEPPLLVEGVTVNLPSMEGYTFNQGFKEGLEIIARGIDKDLYVRKGGNVSSHVLNWYPEEYEGHEKATLLRYGIHLYKAGKVVIADKTYKLDCPVMTYDRPVPYGFNWDPDDVSVILGVIEGDAVGDQMSLVIRDVLDPEEEGEWRHCEEKFEEDLKAVYMELMNSLPSDCLSNVTNYLNKKEGTEVKVLHIDVSYSSTNIPVQLTVEYMIKGKVKTLVAPVMDY